MGNASRRVAPAPQRTIANPLRGVVPSVARAPAPAPAPARAVSNPLRGVVPSVATQTVASPLSGRVRKYKALKQIVGTIGLINGEFDASVDIPQGTILTVTGVINNEFFGPGVALTFKNASGATVTDIPEYDKDMNKPNSSYVEITSGGGRGRKRRRSTRRRKNLQTRRRRKHKQ